MVHGILPLMPSAMGLMLKVIIAGEVLGQPAYSIGGSMNLEKIDFIIKLYVRRSMKWKA